MFKSYITMSLPTVSLSNDSKPEDLQRKLYFLLEQLTNMSKDLTPMFQQRVSCELLSGLANCLLNDTVYEIVKGLMEIQHVEEKHLEQQRISLMKAQRLEIAKMASETRCMKQRRRRKRELETKHKNDLIEMDKKIILHLDQKVTDQQSTLELAGVPGFYVTSNATEIQVQMHLLDFILRLSRMHHIS